MNVVKIILLLALALSAATQGTLDNCLENEQCREQLRPGQYPLINYMLYHTNLQ